MLFNSESFEIKDAINYMAVLLQKERCSLKRSMRVPWEGYPFP